MTRRVCFRKTVLWFAVLLFTYIVTDNVNNAKAEQLAFAAPGPYQITGIKTSKSDDGIILRVIGSAPPTFTMYELFEPQRIILDIADGSFVDADGSVVESLNLPMEKGAGPVTQIKGKILDDKKPLIARLEMFTAGDASYTVERDGNDILVNFKQKEAAAAAATEPPAKKPEASAPTLVAATPKTPVMTEKEAAPVAPKAQQMETVQPEETKVSETTAAVSSPEKSEPVSMPAQVPVGPSPALEEFAYAGYEKQPITVDFYKIDLHNVFRLFGEISGMNIVIAQGVGGTLTLALDNVPWDFVLDVILNLQNLQAIEPLSLHPKEQLLHGRNAPRKRSRSRRTKPSLWKGKNCRLSRKWKCPLKFWRPRS
jgi:type IV pilus assembly protein PilQ